MGKKKSKKQVTHAKPQKSMFAGLDKIDAGSKVSERVNSVIAKMTAPPETIIDHLKRVGVEFVTDSMSMDGGEPRVFIVIDYEHMVAKELENIRSGGVFKNEYPVKPKGEAAELPEVLTRIVEAAKERGLLKPEKGLKWTGEKSDDFGKTWESTGPAEVAYFGDQPDNEPPTIGYHLEEHVTDRPDDNDDEGEWDLSKVQG